MLATITQTHNNKMTRVVLGSTVLWFSYETLIAFEVRHPTGFVKAVRQNEWGLSKEQLGKSKTHTSRLTSIEKGTDSWNNL